MPFATRSTRSGPRSCSSPRSRSLSRLRPDLFPAAQQTSSFLPGTQGRLGWPLNYWNALGALVALGLPLVLSIATSARTLRAQAAAAAGIPILALCGVSDLLARQRDRRIARP